MDTPLRQAIHTAMKEVSATYESLANEIEGMTTERLFDCTARPANRYGTCVRLIETLEKKGATSFQLWYWLARESGRFEFLKERDPAVFELLCDRAALAGSKGKAGFFDVLS